MIDLIERTLDRGLGLNDRIADSIQNGFDWLFRRDELVLSGRTNFELVHQGDLMSVRYYDLKDEREIKLVDGSTLPVQRKKHLVPLVLVPPLGVTSDTFDLMPNRSLARYMAARGFKTYLIDWGKPEKRHAHLGIKDYADDMMSEALAKVREHSGQEQVSLMGWCLGGLLSIIHAGLEGDPRILNIVTVASPINFRAGGMAAVAAARLDGPVRLIRKYTLLDTLLDAVDPASLHTSGRLTTLLFKMLSPVASITTYWDLLTRLSDRKFVESYSTTSNYLDNMLMYPGGVLKEMLRGAVMDNALFKGRIKVGKKTALFGKITASTLVFAGETDELVKVPMAKHLMDLIAVEDKTFVTAAGGHMGVILGSKAQKAVWETTADWLAKRSRGTKPVVAAVRRRPVAARRVAARRVAAKPRRQRAMPVKAARVS